MPLEFKKTIIIITIIIPALHAPAIFVLVFTIVQVTFPTFSAKVQHFHIFSSSSKKEVLISEELSFECV